MNQNADKAKRAELIQKFINQLQAVHEAIVEVGKTAEEISANSPVLGTVIMLALLEAQEPLAILHGSAKKALAMESEEVPAPAFVN